MTNNIKKLFIAAKVKAEKKREKPAEGSLLNIKLTNATDHYTLCPFRSIDAEDCPLCVLESLDL